jgi:16S rRNA C1402 (ribose-2'-O) methylase RsmI
MKEKDHKNRQGFLKCEGCGKNVKKLRQMEDGRKICSTCYESIRKAEKFVSNNIKIDRMRSVITIKDKPKKHEKVTIKKLKKEISKLIEEKETLIDVNKSLVDVNAALKVELHKLQRFITEFYKDCSAIEQYLNRAKEIKEKIKK